MTDIGALITHMQIKNIDNWIHLDACNIGLELNVRLLHMIAPRREETLAHVLIKVPCNKQHTDSTTSVPFTLNTCATRDDSNKNSV